MQVLAQLDLIKLIRNKCVRN